MRVDALLLLIRTTSFTRITFQMTRTVIFCLLVIATLYFCISGEYLCKNDPSFSSLMPAEVCSAGIFKTRFSLWNPTDQPDVFAEGTQASRRLNNPSFLTLRMQTLRNGNWQVRLVALRLHPSLKGWIFLLLSEASTRTPTREGIISREYSSRPDGAYAL
jgi:hypothetical protein